MEIRLKPNLRRYPPRRREKLQPWDAADELVLQHLAELELKGKKILVVNDPFGALSTALEAFEVTCYTDSFLSSQSIRLNSEGRLKPIAELSQLSGVYDLVLIRIPKSMAYFEDVLDHLSQHLHGGSRIICGYMIKHQAKTAFELLGRIIGETTTSLARKKARLIFAGFQRAPRPSPYPLQVQIESFDKPFENHSKLFSLEKLDIGTRFLLGHIPKGDFPRILDLGCGNGIVGIAAKQRNPKARLIFSDESWMAIQSTKENYRRYFPEPENAATYHWTHGYENQPANSVDLVLCNPPFHQGTARDDFTAREMFADAFRVLSPAGTLRVIGNSHLQYQVVMRRIFGNAAIVATDRHFMIVDSVKGEE